MYLEIFFKEYEYAYTLIGGIASSLLLDDAGLQARATKDFDIVLCIEALDSDFVDAFWEFIIKGKYTIRLNSKGTKTFYRFEKPIESDYPYMLEIFSNKPHMLTFREEGTIVPMTVEDEIVSLSAILLDGIYYSFIMSQRKTIDNLVIANEYCIIPLKVKAWIDYTIRQSNGEAGVSKQIKKHKNDVYRLSQLLVGETLQNVPEQIKVDISTLVDYIRTEEKPEILMSLKIGFKKLEEIAILLEIVYDL